MNSMEATDLETRVMKLEAFAGHVTEHVKLDDAFAVSATRKLDEIRSRVELLSVQVSGQSVVLANLDMTAGRLESDVRELKAGQQEIRNLLATIAERLERN